MPFDASGKWVPDTLDISYTPANFGVSGNLGASAGSMTSLGQTWGSGNPVTASSGFTLPDYSLGQQANSGFGGMVGAAGSGSGYDLNSGGNGWNNLWGALGSKDDNGKQTQGWGGLALGGVQTGFNIWQGMNQLKVAKDQLNFTKDAFNKNYTAQQQSTNTALADRQSARVASNAGAYQSVGEYMNQNRIA